MPKRIISINLILFSLFLGKCGFAGISENTTDLEPAFMRNYAEVKETIQDKTGISFGLNISYMPQRLAPNGKKTAWQDIYSHGNYLAFISVKYSQQFEKFGEGAYAFLTYYQPAVEEQDQYSWGWSLNTEQHLSDKWLILLRASGAENTLNAFKQSYMAAVAYKNPLNRNPLDAVIFGIAYNRIEKSNFEDFALDAGESAYELQWIWGISRWLTITPDMQFYPRAAFNSDTKFVLVSGIRFTFML